MSSLNKHRIIGNLGRDPDCRTMQNGGKVVNLSVACSETWKDRDGNRQEKTEWIRVVIFDERLADVAEKYLRKGSKVYLEGAVRTRKWTDQSGQEKYSTETVLEKYRGELIMLDGKSSSQTHSQGDSGYGGGGIDEDSIPFGPSVL